MMAISLTGEPSARGGPIGVAADGGVVNAPVLSPSQVIRCGSGFSRKYVL
jgi:hypothetical protein